ncbi:MAG: hypothetical protein RL263_823, partial [Bacteroidota bacterium]
MKILNYINGELKEPAAGAYLDNYDPSIGQVYGQVPDSDSTDVADAYKAAAAAQKGWENTPSEEKFKVLNAIAEG